MQFQIPDFPLGALLATTLCIVGLSFIPSDTPTFWLWEVLAAVAFVAWAIGGGFLNGGRNESREIEDLKVEEGEQEASSDQKEGQAEVSADTMALIQAIRIEGRANRKEERREESGARIREQITIVFVGFTMGAIILQVHEMVKVYEPIRSQAKAATEQAKAAIAQSDAAQIEAKAVRDQVENAKKAALDAHLDMVLSQRAFVGPTGATLEGVTKGADVKITISYQNSGRQPAFDLFDHVDSFVDSEYLTPGLQAKIYKNVSDCQTIDLIAGSQVVYPSSGFGGGGQYHSVIDKSKIDDGLLNGEKQYILSAVLHTELLTKRDTALFALLTTPNKAPRPILIFVRSGHTPTDNDATSKRRLSIQVACNDPAQNTD